MTVRYLRFTQDPLGCRLCRIPATRYAREGFIVRRDTDGAQLFPASGVCEDREETEAAAAGASLGAALADGMSTTNAVRNRPAPDASPDKNAGRRSATKLGGRTDEAG